VAENPRIEELRRRVQKDPASIAFAQLAEEQRRAGEFDEAIRVSRTGLTQHPGYLSARVTLGRALLETGQYEQARAELEQVLRTAPDNLAAIRALAEVHQRLEKTDAPSAPVPDPEPPRPDRVLAELDAWLAAIVGDRESRRAVKDQS
jgi:Flp pilus assembly protein TadD